jgi:hypothetical protein
MSRGPLPKGVADLKGKAYSTWPHTLDTAHAQNQSALVRFLGLSSTIVQLPTDANGDVAIVHAQARWLNADGDPVSFDGIGDASPTNTTGVGASALLRMAECVPLGAQILTRSGWKYHDELTVGEDVLAYDLPADVCRWTPLQDMRVYRQPLSTVRLHSRSFDVTCTPNHSWAMRRTGRYAGQWLRVTSDFRHGDAIVVAAPEPAGGGSALTPREAALLGWLATDGTIRDQMVGRRWGPYRRATIAQSKPHDVAELRTLVGADGHEQVSAARTRDFGSYVSDCLPQHRFELTSRFAAELLDKAGFHGFADLPSIVPTLSVEARGAMLDAMLKGDGTRKGGTWEFGKKARPGVMEAFGILATLEGIALGKLQTSSVGDVPIYHLRKNRVVAADYLTLSPGRDQAVWCPTTTYGTWVMRLGGCITITGNTRAKGRALRDSVNIGDVLEEELSEAGSSPAQTAVPRQPRTLAMVPQPMDREELRAAVQAGLAADPEAQAKIPKPVADMSEGELNRTLAWLARRSRALGEARS